MRTIRCFNIEQWSKKKLLTPLKALPMEAVYEAGYFLEMAKSELHQLNVRLLRSIPSVGLLTAMTLLLEFENLQRFRKSDQIAGNSRRRYDHGFDTSWVSRKRQMGAAKVVRNSLSSDAGRQSNVILSYDAKIYFHH